MTRRSEGKEVLLSAPPWMSGSADEFASLRTVLELEIKLNGIVEQIHVDDIAANVWEIRRLRRCKTSIINNASRVALQSLLRELVWSPEHPHHHDEADARQYSADFISMSLPLSRRRPKSRSRALNCSTGCWPLWSRAATRRFASFHKCATHARLQRFAIQIGSSGLRRGERLFQRTARRSGNRSGAAAAGSRAHCEGQWCYWRRQRSPHAR
jgi:hypothetical protein